MTGHLAYVLTTTPTILVPLSLIRMGIELKPYAMFLNFPSDCEADRYGALRDHGSLARSVALGEKSDEPRNGQPVGPDPKRLSAQKRSQVFDESARLGSTTGADV
jgi:hypothetical protein